MIQNLSCLSHNRYTLIQRLRHNVIKTGLRKINVAYSRISLADVCTKLHLGTDGEDAEFIVAKAIRDGVIEATIDHAGGYIFEILTNQFASCIYILIVHKYAVKRKRRYLFYPRATLGIPPPYYFLFGYSQRRCKGYAFCPRRAQTKSGLLMLLVNKWECSLNISIIDRGRQSTQRTTTTRTRVSKRVRRRRG